jgi:hypothetical protein
VTKRGPNTTIKRSMARVSNAGLILLSNDR